MNFPRDLTKRVLLTSSLLLIPVLVLAQGQPGDPGAPNQPITATFPWTTVIEGAFSVLGVLLTWLLSRIKANSDQTTAQGQLVTLADSIRQRVWDTLSLEARCEIAKGNWKPFEQEILSSVKTSLLLAVDNGLLSNLAKSLKIPMASVVGTISTYIIEHFLAAHDEDVGTVSKNVYPIAVNDEGLPIQPGTVVVQNG